MDYLKYREENSIESEYLFLTKGYNHSQLTKSGVEWFISKIGATAGVSKCHPHRFRRTFATSLLIKGMPIEQVRILMGHTKIDTTLIYAQTDQEIVKVNYKKIML
jgi:site-specific recombinase XerD